MSTSALADYHIFGVLSDGDLNAGAQLKCDSINTKDVHNVVFAVNIQAVASAATYVKLFSGATDGTCTSALTFRYAFGAAAQGSASGDVFTTWSTSANLAVAASTYDGFALLIEIDVAEMDLANAEEYLTLTFNDTDTGSTGNVSVTAVAKTRYKKRPYATVLV